MSESGDRLIATDTQAGQEILPDRERAEQEKKRADMAEKELQILKMKLKEIGIAEEL